MKVWIKTNSSKTKNKGNFRLKQPLCTYTWTFILGRQGCWCWWSLCTLFFFLGIMIVKFVLANIFESESITLQSTLRSVLISIDLVVIVYLFVLRVDLESEELSNRFLQFVLMILYCLFYHVRGRLRAHKNVSPVPFLCVCLKLQSCTPEDVYLCP